MKYTILALTVALLSTQCLAFDRQLRSFASSSANAVSEGSGVAISDASSTALDGGVAISDADSLALNGGVAISEADSFAAHGGQAISDADSNAALGGVAISNADSTAIDGGVAKSDAESTAILGGVAISEAESTALDGGLAVSNADSVAALGGVSHVDIDSNAIHGGVTFTNAYSTALFGSNIYVSIFSFAAEEQKIIADFCAYGAGDVAVDVEHSIFVQHEISAKDIIEFYLAKLVLGCPSDLLVSALSIQLVHCSDEMLVQLCHYGFMEAEESFKVLFIRAFEYCMEKKTCDVVKTPLMGLFTVALSPAIDTCLCIETKKVAVEGVLPFDIEPKNIPVLPENHSGFPPCTMLPTAQFCCGPDQLKHPKCNCGAFGICQWHQGEVVGTGPAFWKCNNCEENVPFCICPY